MNHMSCMNYETIFIAVEEFIMSLSAAIIAY